MSKCQFFIWDKALLEFIDLRGGEFPNAKKLLILQQIWQKNFNTIVGLSSLNSKGSSGETSGHLSTEPLSFPSWLWITGGVLNSMCLSLKLNSFSCRLHDLSKKEPPRFKNISITDLKAREVLQIIWRQNYVFTCCINK